MSDDRPAAVPFARWKAAVGFPDEFPRLGLLSFDQGADLRFYSPAEIQLRRDDLMDRLARGNLRVVVPLGHGATTLARWVVNRVEVDCLRMRMIPVLVSLDDLVSESAVEQVVSTIDSVSALRPPSPPFKTLAGSAAYLDLKVADISSGPRSRKLVREVTALAESLSEAALGHIVAAQVIDETVHREVARSLVSNPWERVTGQYIYGVLTGSRYDDPNRHEHLAKLRQFLVPRADNTVDWEAIRALAPQLQDRAALGELLQRSGIKVAVNLDLSPTRYGRFTVRAKDKPEASWDQETPWFQSFLAEQFLTYLKNQESAASGGVIAQWNSASGSVVGVTQYLSRSSDQYLSRYYAEAPEAIIQTATFDPLDVFAVVAAHYPQDRTYQSRPELVSAVMSTGVIEQAAQSPRMALTSMVQLLNDILTGWENFTYHAEFPELRGLRGLPERFDSLDEEVAVLRHRIAVLEDHLGLGSPRTQGGATTD